MCIWGATIDFENKYKHEYGAMCHWTDPTLATTDLEKFLDIFLLLLLFNFNEFFIPPLTFIFITYLSKNPTKMILYTFFFNFCNWFYFVFFILYFWDLNIYYRFLFFVFFLLFYYQFCTFKNLIFSIHFHLGIWLLAWLLSHLLTLPFLLQVTSISFLPLLF